jgi:hypothetical protein
MKAIELTDKGAEKLIEMICKLFPNDGTIRICNKNFVRFIDKEPTIAIHWFEFCITKLAPEMLKYAHGITIKFDGEYNPIDFLYEKFKNIR